MRTAHTLFGKFCLLFMKGFDILKRVGLDIGSTTVKAAVLVPENRIFVMGDHRSVSVDSRSTTVGCVSEEQLVGKLVFRVWPIGSFGTVR